MYYINQIQRDKFEAIMFQSCVLDISGLILSTGIFWFSLVLPHEGRDDTLNILQSHSLKFIIVLPFQAA